MNGDPRTRNSLRWSFHWKKFVINRNDVKPFSEVIKNRNKIFNIEVCRAGVSNFLSEVADLIM